MKIVHLLDEPGLPAWKLKCETQHELQVVPDIFRKLESQIKKSQQKHQLKSIKLLDGNGNIQST